MQIGRLKLGIIIDRSTNTYIHKNYISECNYIQTVWRNHLKHIARQIDRDADRQVVTSATSKHGQGFLAPCWWPPNPAAGEERWGGRKCEQLSIAMAGPCTVDLWVLYINGTSHLAVSMGKERILLETTLFVNSPTSSMNSPTSGVAFDLSPSLKTALVSESRDVTAPNWEGMKLIPL